MSKEDIIRMAREAGVELTINEHGNQQFRCFVREIERFAALIASAERERLTNAAMKAAEKAVDVAIALEREACAKLCDELDRKSWEETGEPMSGYGDAIRERT